MGERAKLKVFRYDDTMKQPTYSIYEIPKEKGLTVLQALFLVKDLYHDPPGFRRYQCNRGQCCSCLMTIDGEIKRACTTEVSEEMLIEPLQDYPIIRDLIVDFGKIVDGRLIRRGTMILWPRRIWEPERKIRNFLTFSKEKCTGCGMCQEVCPINSMEHLSTKFGTETRNPVLFEIEKEKVDLKGVCFQCANAPCMYFCPAKVISRNEETGGTCVDEEFCIGCGMCITACPNEAIFLDMERGKAVKCELCGGEPRCVQNCPTEALQLASY